MALEYRKQWSKKMQVLYLSIEQSMQTLYIHNFCGLHLVLPWFARALKARAWRFFRERGRETIRRFFRLQFYTRSAVGRAVLKTAFFSASVSRSSFIVSLFSLRAFFQLLDSSHYFLVLSEESSPEMSSIASSHVKHIRLDVSRNLQRSNTGCISICSRKPLRYFVKLKHRLWYSASSFFCADNGVDKGRITEHDLGAKFRHVESLKLS